ncbi:MAG: cohesin domain-containing protein [Chloroflexota bacterium]
MKKRTLLIYLMFLLTMLVLPTQIQAEGEARLKLEFARGQLDVGQEIRVPILVENAPLIYGVESHLTFDPTVLEVVSLEHGTFLTDKPDEKAFVLQQDFNNNKGTIDYALALLNPAPPVEGAGLLATVTFRARGGGEANLVVTETLFGTQQGEEIVAVADPVAVTVIGAPAPAQRIVGADDNLQNTASTVDEAATNATADTADDSMTNASEANPAGNNQAVNTNQGNNVQPDNGQNQPETSLNGQPNNADANAEQPSNNNAVNNNQPDDHTQPATNPLQPNAASQGQADQSANPAEQNGSNTGLLVGFGLIGIASIIGLFVLVGVGLVGVIFLVVMRRNRQSY